MMILIISQNNEITTTEVIKELISMGKKFIRVHEDEIFEIKVRQKRILLQSSRSIFFLDEITSVWFRRGGLTFKRLKYTHTAINLNMNETQHWLEDYVRKTLESKRHINKESNAHINKLLVLDKAKELGFDVPEYYLAENTDDVNIGNTIIKTITGNVMLEEIRKNSGGFMYTSVVDEHEEGDFFITFFQKKIEKDFEIRTFYLNGQCWSMAIFSQKDEKTKIDFRKYNETNPNRNVPYILPSHVEEKIQQLMEYFDLNCGSLDFIKKGDHYYFLEINPIGQFLGMSHTCNYSLEQKIADYL